MIKLPQQGVGLRIAIDGSPALGIQTGIGKYTFNLIKQLKKMIKKMIMLSI